MIQDKKGNTYDAQITGEPVMLGDIEAYPVRFNPPIKMGAFISTSPVDAYLRADMIAEHSLPKRRREFMSSEWVGAFVEVHDWLCERYHLVSVGMVPDMKGNHVCYGIKADGVLWSYVQGHERVVLAEDGEIPYEYTNRERWEKLLPEQTRIPWKWTDEGDRVILEPVS